MQAPRAGRGGERARGTRGNTSSSRGAAGRGRGTANAVGNGNGNAAAQTNGERPSQGLYARGQSAQRGQRGGRGSQNTRGGGRGQDSKMNPFTAGATTSPNSTPHATEAYQMRYEHIKAARPKLRQQFINEGRMNPEGQMRLSDSVKLYGICEDMCPEYERVRRIHEDDVLPPECTPETEHLGRKQRVPDESRMVKAYARSAAGTDVELVSEIRSPQTCLKTMQYLFGRLDHDSFDHLHRWIWDRARAVRKDLRTQCIESKTDITILLTCLEQSARFQLLSPHHMANSTKDDYDHQQDVEQLNQTITSLKERYIDNRRANIPSENEAEFWAYRLILAPIYKTAQLEDELHHAPSEIRNNARVKTAVEIFRALKSLIITPGVPFVQCQSNWKRFWDLVKSSRVSYLMACAAEISFQRVRHVVLNSVWRAYRRGPATVDTWTVDKLTEVLGLDDVKETEIFCKAYGFQFDVNESGHTFLDIKLKRNDRKVLEQPEYSATFKKQWYSASIVEPKRHDRAISAVIQGMTVQQARQAGMIDVAEMEMQNQGTTEDHNSLFIPEATHQAPTNTFNPFLSSAGGNMAKTNGNSSLNVFASPFQPTPFQTTPVQTTPVQTAQSATPPASNPFLKVASQTQSASNTGIESKAGTHSGLFDPKKDSIKFATPSSAFVTTQPTSQATPVNPFLSKPAAVTQPMSRAETVPSFITPKAPTFSFTGSNTLNNIADQQIQTPGTSFTPSGSPQPDATPADAEQQHLEQERRRAEERQRQEAETRKRAEEARRIQEAQEAEQRRREALAAEQHRQEQVRQDQLRRAREEQERVVREAQERQKKIEEAKRREFHEKEQALQALTEDITFHPEDGLLRQFIENAVLNIGQEVMIELARERAVAWADKTYRKYEMGLKRAGLVKIVAHAEKRKRDRKVRDRRKRLKEQRARAATSQKEAGETSMPRKTTQTSDSSNGASISKQPSIAQSTERTESEGIKTRSNTQNVQQPLRAPAQPVKPRVPNDPATQADPGYSQAYQQSTAPIDRTETDWFKLRAMGIDPTKHRKRSLDSGSEREKEQQTDTKRPKLSPPASSHTEAGSAQVPTTTVVNGQKPQSRTGQQEPHHPTKSPLESNHGATVVRAAASLNGSDELIARARRSMTTSAAARFDSSRAMSSHGHSRSGSASRTLDRAKAILGKASEVQHDFGRSVPYLGFSTSQSLRESVSGGAFGSSTNRLGYSQRPSRFVPKHLYGKGPEAIRAYLDQYVKKPSEQDKPQYKKESLEVSSPIMTQLSYIPAQDGFEGSSLQQFTNGDGTAFTDANSLGHTEALAEDLEDEKISESRVGESEHWQNPMQPYYAQPNGYDSDEGEDEMDSDMFEEDEQEDEDADDESEEEEFEDGYDLHQNGGEASLDQYEEYTDEEDEEEDMQCAQMASRAPFAPATIQSSGPGATEDDAIELSD